MIEEKGNIFQLKTPVCLIIFKRFYITEKVFEAIRQAKPPKLLVIADGPRADRIGEAAQCAATRTIINRVDWDCEVLTNYSDVNLGGRKRISSGLNWVFNQVEEAIILEDDCLPDPTFFRFCEELLEQYRNDERIMLISGDNLQYGRKRTEYSYYFSRYAHIWGWASWRRAWKHYDDQMSLWPEIQKTGWLEDLLENEQLIEYWSYYFQGTYSEQITYGWDCRFLFACWVQNGLSILPNVNLISNIGFGPDASHTKDSESVLANIPVEAIHFPLQHPPFVIRDTQADDFTEQIVYSGVSSKSNKKPTPASTLTIGFVIEQAIAQLNANNNTEALSLLEEAMAFSPDLLGLNYGKAIAQARLGHTHEAIESLNHLLAAVPNHQKAKQLLAELRMTS